MSLTKIQITMIEAAEYFGSQKALAEAAGRKQPSANEWIKGKKKPDATSLLRIQKKSRGKFKAKDIRPELF